MSDWSCRQREARSHLRLFHLVLGSHDGRALVPIPKRSAYPASDLDVVVVDSLKALDPNRPIREVRHRGTSASCQYVWPGRAEQDGFPRSTDVSAATMY